MEPYGRMWKSRCDERKGGREKKPAEKTRVANLQRKPDEKNLRGNMKKELANKVIWWPFWEKGRAQITRRSGEPRKSLQENNIGNTANTGTQKGLSCP